MTRSRPDPGSPAVRLLQWALRPPASSDRPPPLWNWPPLRRRFFPGRPSLFPNRLVPLVILVGMYLAAPVLLWLLALYYFVRSARLLVWWLFRDETAPDLYDPVVTRVKQVRTWAAVTISCTVLGYFASFADFAREKLAEPLRTLILAPWLFAASAAVVITVLIRCAPAGQRRAMRAALRGPLRRFGSYVGTLVLACALCAVLLQTASTGPDHVLDRDQGGWPVKAATAALVWLALVFLLASARAVQTGFGLAGVHPALPALLTGILVWELFALNGVSDGPPPAIAYPLSLGGPITVSAIVWWEIHRLRTSHGVTLRGGRPARDVAGRLDEA